MNKNINKNFFVFILIFSLSLFASSCKYDTAPQPDYVAQSNYPENVGNIIVNRCATAGCHNTASASAASGLDLSTWEKMFNGNSNGAVTVPYRSDQSTLCFFTNVDTNLGVVIPPTMPINESPLTTSEYLTLRDWIDNGAPDKNGYVKFSENPSRKKFYVANQGCDNVAVFDAEKKVIMRYVDIGVTPSTEAPHYLKVAPDGQHWYVLFYAGNVFQKFRTDNDSLVASCVLDPGQWNTFAFTPDSKKAYLTDTGNGRLVEIDLNSMASPVIYYNVFNNAHGLALNPNNGFIYVTNQYSNYIYKCNPSDLSSPEQIHIEPGPFKEFNSLNPHEIIFSPDSTKYFITCDYSNEVRVMDALEDTLIAVIPSPAKPLEFAISSKSQFPYLFVTCQEATSPQPGSKGAVLVINYNTLTVAKTIDAGFFQPHGIAINEDENVIYVASRNVDPSGPAPHHSTNCGGRNGFMRMIRLTDLTLLSWKNETSVDPYSISYRK